jgi:sarcosine oxidase subunit alpha
VKGPDAGRFLDMLYTGVMCTLPVGKCRYGLMCSENGFLSDDGVVVRLSDDTWLCHTTTGGADRIHAHMEDWLQTEWHTWKVYVANVTEQYAQIAVAGPRAREVLQKLGGMDLTREALPFMTFAQGTLGNRFPARVHRISFSGELSYEIAVPASHGLALWEVLMEAGREWGITSYGTEAMHVLRAEKGYVMIGDETDGTVIPQDLGLGWAISKKKPDYLGKRAPDAAPTWPATTAGRSWAGDARRLRPARGAYSRRGENATGSATPGRASLHLHSPTFDRGHRHGAGREGPSDGPDGQVAKGPRALAARIVDRCSTTRRGRS